MVFEEQTQRYLYDITHQCHLATKSIVAAVPLAIQIVDDDLPLENNYCIAALNDEHIATGHDNNQGIKIWNLMTKECVRKIKGLRSVDSIAKLDSHRLLCYCTATNCMYIYNWQNCSLLETLSCGINNICTFSRKNLLPFNEGSSVLTSCKNGNVALWNLNTRELITTFNANAQQVTCLEYGLNNTFFSGALDATIRVWNLKSRNCENVLYGHKRYVLSLALVQEHKLASSGGDHHIRIWNLENMTCTAVLRGHHDIIRRISMLGGDLLCSASDDNSVIIWDVLQHRKIAALKEGHKGSVFEVISACKGSKVISTSFDKTMRIWNLRSDSPWVCLYQDRLRSFTKRSEYVDVLIKF
jgi:WD40 repeat protein